MECPHLFGNYLLSCKADFGLHIPSTLELNEFCTTVRHTTCPFYSTVDPDFKIGDFRRGRGLDSALYPPKRNE